MMKNLYRGLLIALSVSLLATLPACGESASEDGATARLGEAEVKAATSLSVSAKELVEAVKGGADFSVTAFISSDEADADLPLYFDYNISDEAQIAALSDYVIGTMGAPDSPYYLSVFRFKDGTAAELIDAFAEAVAATYPAYVKEQMVLYNGEAVGIAEGYTMKTYDNGVIIAAYDEDGNDIVFSLIDAACAGVS